MTDYPENPDMVLGTIVESRRGVAAAFVTGRGKPGHD
jgi:hypothetical protein